MLFDAESHAALLSTSSSAESGGICLDENMLEPSDSPSSDTLSPSLSRRSSSIRQSHPVDSKTGLDLRKPCGRKSLNAKFHCSCLQTYADLLSTLRQAEEFDRFGDFVRITDEAYSTLRENLACSQCSHDSQVLQLCSMTLKTLVGTIERACTAKLAPEIRAGEYVLQQEDSTWVGLGLLTRTITSLKAVLAIFKRRLGQSKNAGNCGLQEQEYLDKVVHSIDESMNSMWNLL